MTPKPTSPFDGAKPTAHHTTLDFIEALSAMGADDAWLTRLLASREERFRAGCTCPECTSRRPGTYR